jgi:hypothetical protein
MGKGFIPADEGNCVGDSFRNETQSDCQNPVIHSSLPTTLKRDFSKDEMILWEFGKVIEEKMREKGGFKGLEGLRDEYKQGLMRLGLLEEKRLAEATLKRYGEGVLRVIHPEMMDDLGEYVSGCLLGCDLLQEVDRVVHWLVEGIL